MLSRGKAAARKLAHARILLKADVPPGGPGWDDQRIAERLDMAEIELGILGRQCLSQRIDNMEDLRRQTSAWEKRRDEAQVKVNWQFATADARTKLKRFYPSLEE
jgi:hypothetical protein